MFTEIAAVLAIVILGWIYKALKPPPPIICGSPGTPPVTSPRVKLSDGRHLAYREIGVPKQDAKYKVIVVHGFASSKDINLPISQEFVEEHRIYILFFDRPGYGESDPDPTRSVKSEAFDIQELADKLQLGSKFYVIGISLGAYPVWSCLNYIPHRHVLVVWSISGGSFCPLLVAFFSSQAIKGGFKDAADFRPVDFFSSTLCPSSDLLVDDSKIFSFVEYHVWEPSNIQPPRSRDTGEVWEAQLEKITQQGVYESLHRDLIVGYGKWEFDPIDLSDPIPEGSVHLWQGLQDRIIPLILNRYIRDKLPWIRYHEVPDGGHFMIFNSSTCEAIFRALLQ
ncbi:Alpha/beta hydrolase fold-1 [Dillenia turbinata]|uniref:Alpha/beta hydrolase fold-1 n=1 Tax=Dillenia turbinata TaxID=194707 RepID=A0AAN8V342_9MAGN